MKDNETEEVTLKVDTLVLIGAGLLVILVLAGSYCYSYGKGKYYDKLEEDIGWSICTLHNYTFVEWDHTYYRNNYIMNCGETVKVCEVNGKLKNCRDETKIHQFYINGRPRG